VDDSGECIFCKIIRREIPTHIIYEDNHCIALLDAFPVVRGHSLILLKEHRVNILDADAQDLAALIRVAGVLAPAVMKAATSTGLNLFCNNEKSAGQVVPHIHFHLVPRREGDGLALHWKQSKYKEGEAETVCEKIRSLLAAK